MDKLSNIMKTESLQFFTIPPLQYAKLAMLLTVATALFIAAIPGMLHAQPPSITYNGPQIYHTGAAISPLVPVSAGVAPPGYSSNPVTVASGFNQPYGIATDNLGNLYVANVGDNTVMEIPAGGGIPVSLGTGFNQPTDVAVDAAGNVYVADYQNNAVKEIIYSINTTVILSTDFSFPTGVAVDAAGNVYVADSGDNAVKEIPAGTNTTITLGTSFNVPSGVAVDAAGYVYVADRGSNTVQRIQPGGGGTPVVLGSGFNQPTGVSVDASGNIYVVDQGNALIKKMPAGGGTPIVVGSGFNASYAPYGVAEDGRGNVYVCDEGTYSIQQIQPVGGYYITPALPAGLIFDNTTGIISGTPAAITAPAKYTITAYNNQGGLLGGGGACILAIAVYPPLPTVSYSGPPAYGLGNAISPLTPVVTGMPAPGYAAPVVLGTGFYSLAQLGVDNAGNLYTNDVPNNAILKLPLGIGSPISVGSGFNAPACVTADAAGNLYVADTHNRAVKKIPSGGGTPITLAANGQISLLSPINVTVDSMGYVYVLDFMSNGIYKIPATGGTAVSLGGFPNLSNIQADPAGNLYAGNYNDHTIVKIPAGGGSEIVLASAIRGAIDPTVDQHGNIFYFDADAQQLKEIPADGSPVVTIDPTLHGGNLACIITDRVGDVYECGQRIAQIKRVGVYAISPALPAGLNFDTNTGIISGTPTAACQPTNFTVTAYNDGGGKATTVNISVPPGNAGLAKLKVNKGTLSPVFSTGILNYTDTVSNATTSIVITPTAGNSAAVITVNGTVVTTGTASPAISLAIGANTISVLVTAAIGTATYTLTVIRPPLTDADLSNLKISKATLSPAFASGITSYTANVANSVSSITITPVTGKTYSTITLFGQPLASGTASGSLPLNVGDNTFSVVVTAQDGITTQTYTITVTRAASSNANLSGLVLSAGVLSPKFAPATTSYTASVAYTVSSVTLTPTVADPTASLLVNGSQSMQMGGWQISLNVGSNIITTEVIAQDGMTTKTYTITVTRAALSTNANLSALKISKGTLTPAFASSTTSYTASVARSVTSMTVTPTSADTNATITVNGMTVISHTASGPLTLAAGPNTITTIVTAQDGVTTQTYTLTVTRAGGSADSIVPGISVTQPAETPKLAEDGISVHQGVSPNGDGVNDFLVIEGIQAYPDNKLTIMNRNGQLIYEAKGYDNSSKLFDGHSSKNGQMQLPGTYFYQLDYTVQGITKHKTGYIVLKY